MIYYSIVISSNFKLIDLLAQKLSSLNKNSEYKIRRIGQEFMSFECIFQDSEEFNNSGDVLNQLEDYRLNPVQISIPLDLNLKYIEEEFLIQNFKILCRNYFGISYNLLSLSWHRERRFNIEGSIAITPINIKGRSNPKRDLYLTITCDNYFARDSQLLQFLSWISVESLCTKVMKLEDDYQFDNDTYLYSQTKTELIPRDARVILENSYDTDRWRILLRELCSNFEIQLIKDEESLSLCKFPPIPTINKYWLLESINQILWDGELPIVKVCPKFPDFIGLIESKFNSFPKYSLYAKGCYLNLCSKTPHLKLYYKNLKVNDDYSISCRLGSLRDLESLSSNLAQYNPEVCTLYTVNTIADMVVIRYILWKKYSSSLTLASQRIKDGKVVYDILLPMIRTAELDLDPSVDGSNTDTEEAKAEAFKDLIQYYTDTLIVPKEDSRIDYCKTLEYYLFQYNIPGYGIISTRNISPELISELKELRLYDPKIDNWLEGLMGYFSLPGFPIEGKMRGDFLEYRTLEVGGEISLYSYRDKLNEYEEYSVSVSDIESFSNIGFVSLLEQEEKGKIRDIQDIKESWREGYYLKPWSKMIYRQSGLLSPIISSYIS